jgi:hypothetical protein
MNTLAEIEAAIPRLTVEEINTLSQKLDRLRTERQKRGAVDLAAWWAGIEHLSPENAEAFAADVEAGRAEMNRPIRLAEWES